MSKNGSKNKRKRELMDLEDVDEQARLRLRWLTIKEMEHDHKMRNKTLHLSRKRKRQVDSWVVQGNHLQHKRKILSLIRAQHYYNIIGHETNLPANFEGVEGAHRKIQNSISSQTKRRMVWTFIRPLYLVPMPLETVRVLPTACMFSEAFSIQIAWRN